MPVWGDFRAILGSMPKITSPPTARLGEVAGSLTTGHSFGLRLCRHQLNHIYIYISGNDFIHQSLVILFPITGTHLVLCPRLCPGALPSDPALG